MSQLYYYPEITGKLKNIPNKANTIKGLEEKDWDEWSITLYQTTNFNKQNFQFACA